MRGDCQGDKDGWPGATECRADHEAEQMLCLQSQTVVKTHGAAFGKGLTWRYPLF